MALEPRRRTTMSRKRHKPEEIVAKLRQVDVLLAQGHTVADAIRSIGVTEVDPPPLKWSTPMYGSRAWKEDHNVAEETQT
jgi:type II secretory pathway component PulF